MMLEVVLGVMDLEVVADEKDDEKVVDLIFINFVRSSSGEHGLIEIMKRSKPFFFVLIFVAKYVSVLFKSLFATLM